MKKNKEWKKRAELKGLIKEKPKEIQKEIKVQDSFNTFLGFPRIRGSHNQLWKWDTLEDVNF